MTNFDPFSENEAHNPIQIPVAAQAPLEVDANDDAGQSCRYYARRQGRYTKCCIYVSEQDLLPQIDGFEDAEHMAFDSWEDARRYVTSTCTLQVLPTTEPIMQTYDAAIGNSSVHVITLLLTSTNTAMNTSKNPDKGWVRDKLWYQSFITFSTRGKPSSFSQTVSTISTTGLNPKVQ